MERHTDIPIFVDLDGTVTKSDLLFESLVVALKKNPLVLFMLPYWLLSGIANLKYNLALYADVDCKTLPLNQELYSFILEQKKNNRKIFLATASNQKYAEAIHRHFDVFDGFISSDQFNNLKGRAKLEKIKEISSDFAYAGNSSEDFEIFREARESYLVNPTRRARKLAERYPVDHRLDAPATAGIGVWLKQFRLYQWVKNLLMFVPLLVSGAYADMASLSSTVLGFIAFGCLASGTYIINDLFDLESDRQHHRKKERPIARGAIGISEAIKASLLLFVVAFALASQLSLDFMLVLMFYLGVTLSYSMNMKKYIGIDVILLASLYTIRIIAGAAVIGVTVSFWLLSFSMLVFFSLALVKRCAEIKSLEKQGQFQAKGRDYNREDYALLQSFGASSALLSILTFIFYTQSELLVEHYDQPQLLWLIIPSLAYWLLRMWIKTNRGEMHDDPIVFSLKDRGSLIMISLIVVITLAGQGWPLG